jgi:hypothetical protein
VLFPPPPPPDSAKDKVPDPSVCKTCPFEPSALGSVIPENDNDPVIVVSPATDKFVLFNSCRESDLHLPVIVCDPALTCENSSIPSSVPSLASKILFLDQHRSHL